jgi:GTP-binding protein Era
MPDTPSYKAGYVTIAGKPNVGKSTLLNAILDFRLSIISPRPQTTRRRIMGIMNQPGLQIIFLDTPGIIEAKYKFQQVMRRTIQMSVADADILLFIGEARKGTAENRMDIGEEINLLKRINQQQKPVILAINKIDLIPKNQILLLLKYYSDQYPFSALVPISALKKDGLSDLTHELEKSIPYHPPFYDPDVLTEQPERFFVGEFIREQLFLYFREEVPYSTEVQITEFVEREKGKDLIRAVIYVERESQKGIVIGRQGTALKTIGLKARKVIEQFLNREVYLELSVKVSKNWRRDENLIKKFGY